MTSSTNIPDDIAMVFHIVLLDDTRLELALETRIYVERLLEIIAVKLTLTEREHFGLASYEDTGQCVWLQPDRRLADHDVVQRATSVPIVLHFLVRYYVPSIASVTDCTAAQWLFVNAKQALCKHTLWCDDETLFALVSLAMQAVFGDYTSDDTTYSQLVNMNIIPAHMLTQLTAANDCIIEQYKSLVGTPWGSAVVSFLAEVEKLPMYGVHYYEVKNKKGVFWWLGISRLGIGVYEHDNKLIPKKMYAWRLLENLFFHEKKFSIEVLDTRASTPRQNSEGQPKVRVHSWLAASSRLSNAIWTMAVTQHQFYLDCKHNKTRPVRSLSDLAADLNASDVMSALAVTEPVVTFALEPHPLPDGPQNVVGDGGCNQDQRSAKKAEANRLAQIDKYNELKARKAILEETLKAKLEELYELCVRETDLTGVVPVETPRIAGKPTPTVRKRVGTKFTYSPKFLSPESENSKMSQMELEFEIQRQQMEVALKLSQDKSLARNVRRKHRQSYRDTHLKLKQLETKMNAYRRQVGRSLVNIPDSIEDGSEDSQEFLDGGDPDDLLSIHADDTSSRDAAESESNTSELSYVSETRSSSKTKRMYRSKSTVPPSELHLSESMPKMEIQEYEKPPALISPVRSLSSSSLKEPISPESPVHDIKIYPKMFPQSVSRNSHSNPVRATYQLGTSQGSPSRYRADGTAVPTTPQLLKAHQRRQIRVQSSSSHQRGSSGQSDHSDTCSMSSQTAAETEFHHRRHNNQDGFHSAATSTSTVYSGANSADVQSPVDEMRTYEEHTSTWPRKRAGRSSRHQPTDDALSVETPAMCQDKSDSVDLSKLSVNHGEPTLTANGTSAFSENLPHAVPAGYGTVFGRSLTPTRHAGAHRIDRLAGISDGSLHNKDDSYVGLQSWDQEPKRITPRNMVIATEPVDQTEQILTAQSRLDATDGRYRPSVELSNGGEMTRSQKRINEPLYGCSTPRSASYMSPGLLQPRALNVCSPDVGLGHGSSAVSQDRHAVDVLFDSLYKSSSTTVQSSTDSPQYPMAVPATPRMMATVQSDTIPRAAASHRLKSSQSGSYAALPSPPRVNVTSAHRSQSQQISWHSGSPQSTGKIEISSNSTMV